MTKLSEELVVELPFTEADIGGTNTAGGDNTVHWTDMRGYDRCMVVVELGTFNATDELDTLKIEQAQDADGTGKKDLTTSASGGDYDTDSKLGSDGDKAYIDVRAEDLDVTNGFTHIRVYAEEDDNTGVDNISAVYIKTPQVKHAEINGAASSSLLYIAP